MSAAPALALEERTALPDDHAQATLIGRAWVPGPLAGPLTGSPPDDAGVVGSGAGAWPVSDAKNSGPP